MWVDQSWAFHIKKKKAHQNREGQLLPNAVAFQCLSSALCRQRLTSSQVAKEKCEQGLALVSQSRTKKGGFGSERPYSCSFLPHLPFSLSFSPLLPASLSLPLTSNLIGLGVVLKLTEVKIFCLEFLNQGDFHLFYGYISRNTGLSCIFTSLWFKITLF